MALFALNRREALSKLMGVPPRAGARKGASKVTSETALRQSAVWACLRLRADLMSTLPLDVYRKVQIGPDLIRVDVPKPPVLISPGGDQWDYIPWMWATQFDLDRCGNTVGLISEVDGAGRPARIDLQDISKVTIFRKKGDTEPRYRINSVEYTADKVWHERQFTVAGMDAGLSPVMYAAWMLSEHLSIQDFVLDWYSNGGVPKARLRNSKRKVDPKEATIMKDRFKATMTHGDLFVTGFDWEYDMMQAQQVGMEWLENKKAGVPEISRYFGCPADLIDGAVSGSSVTYASIGQRNLQFLIMNMEPAIVRRETTFSNRLLARPRYVKLNSDALLRMDPETRQKVVSSKLSGTGHAALARTARFEACEPVFADVVTRWPT